MTDRPDYLTIAAHYEDCLQRFGDSHLGVDWPKVEDVATRHRVMLDVIRPRSEKGTLRLLDFGCGAAHLLDFIHQEKISGIEYSGLDVSEKFVELSRQKFPDHQFWCLDVLGASDADLPQFDYVVMSGVFTEKLSLSFDDMFAFMRAAVSRAFAHADRGVAFNVMTKHVDWEREDLFHLPFDVLAAWLKDEISRNFVIRNDYGLYEYTVYVYR